MLDFGRGNFEKSLQVMIVVGFKITSHFKITFHPICENSNPLFRYNNHFFHWQLSIDTVPQLVNLFSYFLHFF